MLQLHKRTKQCVKDLKASPGCRRKERTPFALYSSWTLSVVVVAWETFGRLGLLRNCGDTYASEGMTQLLSALTLLSPPTNCAALEMNSRRWLLCFSMQRFFQLSLYDFWNESTWTYVCHSVPRPEQSTSLLPSEHLLGLLGVSACTNANVAYDQLLNTWAKTNRNHPILILITINDSPYKQNKHITFSDD